MIPRLISRVLPRPFALNVATAVGLRIARQHVVVARTFLTTAHVSEPAAKEGASQSKSTKSKATPKKKVAAKKAATTKKKPAKKAKAGRPTSKVDPDDPEARFKNGLKTVKVKKSEQPPMKPITPYSVFVREQYKDGGLTGTFSEKSLEISARWKQLSDAEKQRYVDEAESQKKVFLKNQEEWYQNTDPRILRAINVKRRADNKPMIHPPAQFRVKRPLSSYMQYMAEVRETIELDSSLPIRDALAKRSRQIGKMWHELPAEEKQRYADQYRKALEEFKAAQSANS